LAEDDESKKPEKIEHDRQSHFPLSRFSDPAQRDKILEKLGEGLPFVLLI